jgi:hypothetical protein
LAHIKFFFHIKGHAHRTLRNGIKIRKFSEQYLINLGFNEDLLEGVGEILE